MEDDKEQTSLIFDSKTSGVGSTLLLSSVSTSSIYHNSFPAQGDTPAESFDNHGHEMLCLLQSLPMDNSTPEQTDISVDTLIDRIIKNQSVSGIDFNVSVNSKNISTKGISSAGVNVSYEGRLKRTFCSNTVFNLSHKVFTKTEIKVLEQGVDFVPTQKCINKP